MPLRDDSGCDSLPLESREYLLVFFENQTHPMSTRSQIPNSLLKDDSHWQISIFWCLNTADLPRNLYYQALLSCSLKHSHLRKSVKTHPTVEQRKDCSVLLSLDLAGLCSIFTWTVCRRGEECGNLFVDVFISCLVRTVGRDPYHSTFWLLLFRINFW